MRKPSAPFALALTAIVVSGSAAHAGISLCNQFAEPIHVALATADDNGGYTDQGWWGVAPNACQDADFAIAGDTLYYTADSDSYKIATGSEHQHWGGTLQLFVSDNKFRFTDAQKSRSGAYAENFSVANVSLKPEPKDKSIRVTFVKGQSSVDVTAGH